MLSSVEERQREMTIRISKTDPKTYTIYQSEKDLGTLKTYHNIYHDTCTYLNIKLETYAIDLPFSVIRQREEKSLAVLTESENKDLIQLLIRNGFKCKRRCFTPIFTKKDLKYPVNTVSVIYPFTQANSRYLECCDLLYQYYKDTHANVSPLTVNRSTFIKDAPTKTGFYSLNRNNRIENLVFTENNEIAYVCSLNRQSYQPFIQTVLNEIFSKFDEIFFEADDTDWAASILLNQFKFNKNESFNTYIYS